MRSDGPVFGDGWWLVLVGHRLMQCRIGGVQVGCQLNTRHVQNAGSPIDVVGYTLFREHVFNIECWQFQDVAQVLFEFFASQSA